MNFLQDRIKGQHANSQLFAPVQNAGQIQLSVPLDSLGVVRSWEEQAQWHPSYKKHLFLNFLLSDGTLIAFGPAPTCHEEQTFAYVQKPQTKPTGLNRCLISKLHNGEQTQTTLEIFTKPNMYILRWPFDTGFVVHISAPKNNLSAHQRLHIQNSLAEFA